jgi:hypothetical protein
METAQSLEPVGVGGATSRRTEIERKEGVVFGFGCLNV